MLTAAFGDLPSVDASGQLDVRDENVDDLSSAPRQRLLAIGCMDDLVAFLSQSLHHELAYERVVLDEEDALLHGQPGLTSPSIAVSDPR